MSTLSLMPGASLGDGSMPPAGSAVVSPAPRPSFVRRETDQILSYYQSEHAGRPFALDSDHASAEPVFESPSQSHIPNANANTLTSHAFPRPHPRFRQDSAHSSASDYSSHYSEAGDAASTATPAPASSSDQFDSEVHTPHTSAEATSEKHGRAHSHTAGHSRRSSVPTEGGADRRRLAIVEMDPPPTTAAAAKSVARKRSKGVIMDGESSADLPASSSMGGTLFSRRGLHIGGLALVAPPDASPKTYTNLSPPSTAPVSTWSGTHPPPSAFAPSHTRSASEAVQTSSASRSRLHHKSSRDVGIVGLSSASTASESLGPVSPTSDEYHVYAQSEGLGVPIFQTPAKSRPPSPGVVTPELSDTSSGSAFRSPHQRQLSTPIFGMEDGIVTPGIGEGKDIRQPVVGPVIVGLSPEMLQRTQGAIGRGAPSVQSPASSSPSQHSSSASSPSQYLHYQPGIHATAGPLPPPPRSIYGRDATNAAPPPRPPRHHTPLPNSARRDIDAIKEALQLPQSVSAKLAARTPPESDTHLARDSSPSRAERTETRSQESAYSQDSESEPSVKLLPTKSVHRREGAFPPSKILASPPGKQSPQFLTPGDKAHISDTRPIVVVEQDEWEDEEVSRRRPGEWQSCPYSRRLCLPNTFVHLGSVVLLQCFPLTITTPKSIRHGGHGGSDDEKGNGSLAPSAFKVLTNLKRFSSLPRTPSRSSKSSKRSSSPDVRRSMSPSIPTVEVDSPPRRRIIPKPKYSHPWPPAMNPADVVVLRGSRERARGYAMKINELSMYDCGLREWMATQSRGQVSHPRAKSHHSVQQRVQPLPAEFGGMANSTRHVSHGSMASEMTFPIRADAYTATDLSTRPSDPPPTTAPPAILPYPALAQVQLQRPAARSSTLILSPTKSLQIPLPGSKSSGTGFFASLGRKTSIRKDKGSLLSHPTSSTTKVLTKQRPIPIATTQSLPPKTTPTPATPSIPGGPRAAPGHIKRAQTYSVGPGPVLPREPSPAQAPSTSNNPSQSAAPPPITSQRQSVVPPRRPSLFARARPGHASVIPTGSKSAPTNMAMDSAFERQVDRLADLLPHADRSVLAGYLRRAGEDILAIGQYLEDEKNGTLRRD
ncbi:hypothetical protein C8Q74DRAFT_1368373 [Fomes fomentarius]|nr:hypothetical protein C8Q74DRAFT_1368373 [Fomes fomentarius]